MQLVLPVGFSKQSGLDTFVEGPNTQVLQHVKDLLDKARIDQLGQHNSADSSVVVNPPLSIHKTDYTSQATQRICCVNGLKGAGKTHFLLAIDDLSAQLSVSHQYINMSRLVKMPTEVLQGISNKRVLCIDDIQAVENAENWQRALFDVINQFVEHSNGLLLLASSKPITELNLSLPDLRTRLQWGINFTIKGLSDKHKLDALIKHAKALGVSFQEDAVKYLVSRSSRDMHSLMQNLEKLDQASLQNKRKITIPFIKSVLSI